MARQTVPLASAQWIVIDDGIEPATVTMGQEYVRRQRSPETTGAQSLCLNLLEALPRVRAERVLIVEHDDYYGPDHLAHTLALLDRPGVTLAGDDKQRYYHVGARRWKLYQNRGSSLAQTGMHTSVLPTFEAVVQKCLAADKYGVDALLWETVPKKSQALEHTAMVVGIKGLPGRKGLGVGHRDNVIKKWTADPDLSVLRQWIGADVEAYTACRLS